MIDFANFESRLCIGVPWNGVVAKRIIRLFDYLIRIDPNTSGQHLNLYLNMYAGDLRRIYSEEEIAYLRWMAPNVSLIQDSNKVIKGTIKGNPAKNIDGGISSVIFYNAGYKGFYGNSADKLLQQLNMDQNQYNLKLKEGLGKARVYMGEINKRYGSHLFKLIFDGFFIL